jgi:hypothetical protein
MYHGPLTNSFDSRTKGKKREKYLRRGIPKSSTSTIVELWNLALKELRSPLEQAGTPEAFPQIQARHHLKLTLVDVIHRGFILFPHLSTLRLSYNFYHYTRSFDPLLHAVRR